MNLDWIILHGLRVLTTCPLLDFWMPRITALGNSGIVWVVAAIVLLCTKKYRRYGVMLLVGLAAALLLGNLALKNLFARPRPCWLDESVPLLIARPRDYSFPSGHTMAGGHRCHHPDGGGPAVWLGGHPAGGAHRVLPPVLVRAFSQ